MNGFLPLCMAPLFMSDFAVIFEPALVRACSWKTTCDITVSTLRGKL